MNGDQGSRAIGAIRVTGLSPVYRLSVGLPLMNSMNGWSDMDTGLFRLSRAAAWTCDLKRLRV